MLSSCARFFFFFFFFSFFKSPPSEVYFERYPSLEDDGMDPVEVAVAEQLTTLLDGNACGVHRRKTSDEHASRTTTCAPLTSSNKMDSKIIWGRESRPFLRQRQACQVRFVGTYIPVLPLPGTLPRYLTSGPFCDFFAALVGIYTALFQVRNLHLFD
jgi:hypothetical protein